VREIDKWQCFDYPWCSELVNEQGEGVTHVDLALPLSLGVCIFKFVEDMDAFNSNTVQNIMSLSVLLGAHACSR
jgi:hypothetical protein